MKHPKVPTYSSFSKIYYVDTFTIRLPGTIFVGFASFNMEFICCIDIIIYGRTSIHQRYFPHQRCTQWDTDSRNPKTEELQRQKNLNFLNNNKYIYTRKQHFAGRRTPKTAELRFKTSRVTQYIFPMYFPYRYSTQVAIYIAPTSYRCSLTTWISYDIVDLNATYFKHRLNVVKNDDFASTSGIYSCPI